MIEDNELLRREITLPDGRRVLLVLWQMIFNQRITLADADDEWNLLNGWCFHEDDAALRAALLWDGVGDPPGWFKNPFRGQYNPEHPDVKARVDFERLQAHGGFDVEDDA